MFGWVGKLVGTLLGGKGGGLLQKGSDLVDRWKPSATTKHKMSLEDLKAGDVSQESAREMEQISHESKFDIFVDGMNRLMRPLMTIWAVGGLAGGWDLPSTDTVDPVMMNIIWTIVTFWFGSRTIFKDIPNAIKIYQQLKNKKG